MNHIFISYSRKDEQLVSWFSRELESRGIVVWQDIAGNKGGIPYSTNWQEAIYHALYTASGALVFRSAAWESSIPCSDERRLIESNHIPCRNIDIAEIDDGRREEILCETLDWCKKISNDPENTGRTWLLSGAYTLKKQGWTSAAVPKVKKLRDTISLLEDLKDMENYAEDLKLKEDNPDIFPFVKKYLKKVRSALIQRQVRKICFLAIAALAFFTFQLMSRAYPMAMEELDIAMRENAYLNMVRGISEYDPIASVSMLTTEQLKLEHVANVMFYSMTDALQRNLPSDFLIGVDSDGSDPASAENDRWRILMSDNSGKVRILNREAGYEKQILLDNIPTACAVDESGEFLAVAAADQAYVYDIPHGYRPVRLAYNFEEIRTIGFTEDGQIRADTAGGNRVIWRNPLQGPGTEDKKIIDGTIAVIDGEAVAVYIKQDSLTVAHNAGETRYPIFGEQGVSPRLVTMSPDGSRAGVLCTAEDGTDIVLVCDVSTGETGSIVPQGNLTSLVFSADGQKLVCGSLQNYGLVELDLTTGTEKYSAEGDAYPYLVQRCGDMYVCADINGMAAVYDKNLKAVRAGIRCSGYYNAPRGLAAASNLGYLFTATRGGKLYGSSVRASLSDGSVTSLSYSSDSEIISNSAVAVSKREKYVAYGNADGGILLYDTGHLYPLWIFHNIGEGIAAMAFGEDDSSLAVMGMSGKIYTLPLPEGLDPDDSEALWQNYLRIAYERYTRMNELQLTYISPDGFWMR